MFEPLIRSCLTGLAFLGTARGWVVESPIARWPGITPTPFAAGPVSNCPGIHPPPTIETFERVYLIDGAPFCSWAIDVEWRCNATPSFSIAFGEVAHVYGGTDTTQVGPVLWDPCDINLNGKVNVLDFMDLLNRPYDWNGDGSINPGDFIAVLERCGG